MNPRRKKISPTPMKVMKPSEDSLLPLKAKPRATVACASCNVTMAVFMNSPENRVIRACSGKCVQYGELNVIISSEPSHPAMSLIPNLSPDSSMRDSSISPQEGCRIVKSNSFVQSWRASMEV